MKHKSNILLLYYLILGILHIASRFGFMAFLRLPSKALLMPMLVVWFLWRSLGVESPVRKMIVTALFFSFLGDVFLDLATTEGEIYFLMGLASFLLTHVLYIMVFWDFLGKQKGFLQEKPLYVLPFLLFLIGINAYLLPSLGTVLQFAVPVYSFVIMLMVLSGLNLKGIVSMAIFRSIFLGAIFVYDF